MKTFFSAQMPLYVWVALMASSFSVSENMLSYANPIASTGLRFILAAILMLPFIINVYSLSINRLLFGRYLLASLFLVLFFVGLFESLKTTSALRTSVIYTLLPLLSVLLSYVVLKIKTPARQMFGFILGTVGASWVMLALHWQNQSWITWQMGDSLFLLACISLALHVVLIKKWAHAQPPALSAFYILVCGSVILLPLLLLYGNLWDVAWSNRAFWQSLLYLSLFTTLATFLLQQYLLKKLGPNHLLAFTYLVPVLVLSPRLLSAPHEIGYSLPGLFCIVLALFFIVKTQKNRSIIPVSAKV
ncbi:MAG: DMT family transporter [Pseudomonadales bacterium]|nr:DMT family transporter [Pseudomonadales bacterium]